MQKHWTIAVGGMLVLSTSAMLGGETLDSRAAAQVLTAALDAGKLDAMAAGDPEHPGRLIAALYPGSQLLVLSADYPAPTYIE